MSLLRRFSRALDTLSRPQLDGRSLFGALGEEYASQFLDGPAIVSRVMNPIIPATRERRNPLESDFLVYSLGNLFCIEVKRYKGKITYASKPGSDFSGGRDEISRPGNMQQRGFELIDESTIVQEKTGKYGERLPARTHPNPLKKTKLFIRQLKEYLGDTVDVRFRKLFIIPVVAFVEEADIQAIHSFEAGMIYVRELPTFLQRHAHPEFAHRPSRWVAEGIQRIPTSDLLLTTDDHPFKGFITDQLLSFIKRDGNVEHVPYAGIRSIWLEHTWLFSDYDKMTIFFSEGHFREFECSQGVVHATDFSGERKTHKLRNVSKIIVGRANKVLRLG
jgi:hypothetical protein